jgi:hypothetical protein
LRAMIWENQIRKHRISSRFELGSVIHEASWEILLNIYYILDSLKDMKVLDLLWKFKREVFHPCTTCPSNMCSCSILKDGLSEWSDKETRMQIFQQSTAQIHKHSSSYKTRLSKIILLVKL